MVKIAHASSDERGKLTGGQRGDQTGRECTIQDWYSRPWTCHIRCKNWYKAQLISKAMCEAARNDNIGYCQGHRRSLYDEASKVGFCLSKVSTPCECDCSSLVAVACISAGYNINPDVYTGNIEKALLATGDFEVRTDAMYTQMTSALIPGDILLYPGHHVAVVVAIDNLANLPNGWVYMTDGWHYRRDNLNILDGFEVINGHKYLFQGGVMQKGLTYYWNKWYYFEPDDAHPYQGAVYITDKDGAMELGVY